MPLAAIIPAVATVGSALIASSAADSQAKKQVAATQAASQLQSQAQTQNGQIIGAGALQGADTLAAANLQAANTGAQGYLQGGQTISDAANLGAQTQLGMYQQTRSDLNPFISTGTSALSQLASLFGLNGANGGMPNGAAMTSALTATPGYQFGRDQGSAALDRSAASRGLALSGSQLQAQQQFGTDYAIQQAWQPYVTQLNTLASGGQSAATNLGQLGGQAASGAASDYVLGGQALGNAQAQAAILQGQGQLGAGQALSTGQINAANAYGGAGVGAAEAGAAGITGTANIDAQNANKQQAILNSAGSQLYSYAQPYITGYGGDSLTSGLQQAQAYQAANQITPVSYPTWG